MLAVSIRNFLSAWIGLAALAGCANDGSLDLGTGTTGTGDVGDAADGGDARDAGDGDASTTGGDGSANSSGLTGNADADAGDGGSGCDTALVLTLRDFTEEHDDFENRNAWETGLVEDDLGPDRKPVYAHTGSTSATEGPEEFDQWYRDTPDVNMTFTVEIEFTEDPQKPGSYVYDESEFFPLDGMGYGNGPGEHEHNFLFTTEAHTRFTYTGGEEFTFRGDDDLWVFINGKLAIDLGGVHGVMEETIDLDDEADRLGIETGMTYNMDIFHAERHTSESNFRIETTIDLSCIENVPII